MSQAPHPKVGVVYALWAVGTSRWKIGYTSRTAKARAYDIEQSSPYPIAVIATMEGAVADERTLQREFRRFNTHREWFDLPEAAAWKLLERFGITRDYVYASVHLV